MSQQAKHEHYSSRGGHIERSTFWKERRGSETLVYASRGSEGIVFQERRSDWNIANELLRKIKPDLRPVRAGDEPQLHQESSF